MIVVAVTYKMKVDKREEALRAARICSEKTRCEEGNLDYTFYKGIDDEVTFFLFEQWESRNALAAHLKTGHLAAFRAALKELQERPSAIRVFEAEETKL